MKNYQICNNCVMDTSDSMIKFNEDGVCEYCLNYINNIKTIWSNQEYDEIKILPIIEKIKKNGRGNSHDCLIGLSGGVDSSYVTHLATVRYGLKPLLFHVDAGWNTQEAVNNIEKLVDKLGLDLYTEVVNWKEMSDLQLSYFKSGVPHLDTPQDHVFFAGLYNFAKKQKIKYILTGANYSTECVREPLEWHYHASDLSQLKAIHKQFGSVPLKTLPTSDILTYKILYRFLKGIQVIKPLNYIRYIKEIAMQELIDLYGWQKYAHKHYESRFTRFFEGFWLLEKFGYDKRRAHFSSLILTGQMTREEALDKLAKRPYDEKLITQDIEYIANKLDITVNDLKAMLAAPNKTYKDYPNKMIILSIGTNLMRALGHQRSVMR